jgi:NADH-quinone oxidoreductase subunit E
MDDARAIDKGLEEVFARFEGRRGELIGILQSVQEKLGYLPDRALLQIARFTKVPESQVFGVSSFYAQFRFTPMGRRRVMVCQGTACHVRGGAKILEEAEKQLHIKPGGTTPDMEYSLDTVACIGCCSLAPCVMVNKEVFASLTPKKVSEVLAGRGEG